MTEDLQEDAAVQRAVEILAGTDRDLARLLEELGPPPSRREPPGFATLIRILTAQQVSLASASAIWTRLNEVMEVSPEVVSKAADDDFRAAGFSRPKVRYARALADHLLDGRLDLDALGGMEDDTARAKLVAVPGIGRWTADIYLLFCLGRLNVWPGGDLAIQEALKSLKHLQSRPKERETLSIAAAWKPYRGVAAQQLWQYYRHLKFGKKSDPGAVLPVTAATSH